VPQIGWNTLEEPREPLLGRAGLDIAYFANGYVARPLHDDVVTAWSTHEGDRFPAVVGVGRTIGVQFHPEKSSDPGVRFLREFIEAVSAGSLGGIDAATA
jgi:glutamine amidotransferase